MSKNLVIVESPAKARSLSKFLGKKYTVKASMGHVRDLPRSQLGVAIEDGFKPKYINIRGKGNVIKELKEEVKKADQVLLAPDPDREGEAIAWHLQDLLKIDGDRPCRIEFNEITRQAVQEALKKPRPIDSNRVNSQQARRILDRLVGYSLSPLLWQKIKGGLSAGRVQSVAVRLICDREEEIKAFIPEEYWSLVALLARDGDVFEAKLFKIDDEKANIKNQSEIEEILKELENSIFRVGKVVKQERTRHPAPPFTTSSLQQEAYRKLNFTARRTMLVAQQLYEGLDVGEDGPVGLVTYIRTDSSRVSSLAQDEARSFIQARFGQQYVPEVPRQVVAKGRIQDAHEAIRPTSIFREPESVKKYLTDDQYKLYKLIWSRFVASQMSPAIFDTTTVDIQAGRYLFRATGSIIKFAGFMQVYIESFDDGVKEEEGILPELVQGEVLLVRSLTPRQHFTQPPPRYTDASLVKALEEKGIGRPSTYAPIVETILKRGYVVREKKQFVPTELGIVVVDLLKKYFPDIIDVEFTAGMEEKLDKIEEGDLDWTQVIREFYYPFHQTVLRAESELGRITVPSEVTGEICELCGRSMVVKTGRYGKFLACSGYPECSNTRPLLESLGVPCPQCGGELVVRRSKKGRQFYGCNRFPECEFTLWDMPSQQKCPKCGALMVFKGQRKKRLQCINEKCRMKLETNENAEAQLGASAVEDGQNLIAMPAAVRKSKGNNRQRVNIQ